MKSSAKTWALVVFLMAALCSCASISEHVVFWARADKIEAAKASSARVGLQVDDEAYRESLKRWPHISDAGLQRRALLYSLLKAQNQSLEPWLLLSAQEDLSLELAQIASLDRRRSAF